MSVCRDFTEKVCDKLHHPPYVCNKCHKRVHSKLAHHYYDPNYADLHSRKTRVLSREGIDITKTDLIVMVEKVKKYLAQGQSLEAIWATHKDEFPVSVRTFYRYIEKGYLGLCNLNLPKKVTYKIRKKNSVKELVVRSLILRDYVHYLKLKC